QPERRSDAHLHLGAIIDQRDPFDLTDRNACDLDRGALGQALHRVESRPNPIGGCPEDRHATERGADVCDTQDANQQEQSDADLDASFHDASPLRNCRTARLDERLNSSGAQCSAMTPSCSRATLSTTEKIAGTSWLTSTPVKPNCAWVCRM